MAEHKATNDTPEFPSKLEITPAVMAIARRLERAGHETWCVGGAVRDHLLGIPNNDVDLATSATPDEVQSLFRRTVPIGVSHGTVAVLDRHNVAHEVTTFRADVKTDGRHAEVVFGVSLDEDLARRDFTINAIAYHPAKREWRDPHHGVQDIHARLVRAVGEPARRFQEDYLRILRCIRFATRFAFSVDVPTWAAACEHRSGLKQLSAERVRDEWFKSVMHAKTLKQLCGMWSEVGADAEWLCGADLSTAPLDARVRALDARDVRDPIVVTAYLSDDPAPTLEALRCSTQEVERGRRMAKFRSEWPMVQDAVAVRRWMSKVGPAMSDLILISEIDGSAAGLADAVRRVQEAGDPLTQAALAVNGTDLMKLGVPKGPAIGATLRRLLDAVLEDPTRNKKATLLALVSRDAKDA